jgi:hypothetical protein
MHGQSWQKETLKCKLRLLGTNEASCAGIQVVSNLLTRSVGKPCSSNLQSSLYTTAPNSKQYFPSVKEDSMIPPALMSDCRATELMSIVFLKCGARIKLMGCNALNCLLVAMIIGSTTACVLVLQQHRTQHIIQRITKEKITRNNIIRNKQSIILS